MPLEYRDDEPLIVDTGRLAALTGRKPSAVRLICKRGPNGYDAHDATERLKTTPDPIMLTAAEAQQWLGLNAGTIRQWVNRGELHPRDRNQAGHALYAVYDLSRLIAQWRKPRQRGTS